MRDMAQARREMVDRLRVEGITYPRVLAAVSEVPRERFVSSEFEPEAYEETPLEIGEGQTTSTPWIVAFSTSALQLSPESTVRIRTLALGRRGPRMMSSSAPSLSWPSGTPGGPTRRRSPRSGRRCPATSGSIPTTSCR